MTAQTRLADLLAGIQTQVQLDAFVARAGGLRAIWQGHFAEETAADFGYLWDCAKSRIRRDV